MQRLVFHLLFALLLASSSQAQEPVHALAEAGTMRYVFTIAEAEVGTEEVVYDSAGWTSTGSYELGALAVKFVASWQQSTPTTATWKVDAELPDYDATILTEWSEESIATTIEVTPEDVHVEHSLAWEVEQAPVCFENLVWAVYSEIFLRMLEATKQGLPQVGTKVAIYLPANNSTFDVVVKECSTRQAASGTVLDLLIDVGGQEMFATISTEGLLLHLRVPTQGLVVYAEGHEFDGTITEPTTIVDSGAWRDELSAPTHKVQIEQSVRIPMADGVELVADIYRPEGDGPWPTILLRTPYGRSGEGSSKGSFYARRGFAFVTQDVRGRFDSDGEWFPLRHETADGSDTIDWLAAQDWCDGNVGMIGASYVGWVQWFAAKSGNTHLKAIVPQVSPPDPLENIPYEGGAFMLMTGWWASVLDTSSSGATSVPDLDFGKALATLPLSDLDLALGVEGSFLDEWLAHPPTDSNYWDPLSYQPHFGTMDVAALHITGWFDGDQPGALQNFQGMRKNAKTARARDGQFLVVGPWGHDFNVMRELGDVDFGAEAIIDLDAVYIRFFDRYLKGIENGMEDAGPVFTFTMGENTWHQADSWPLPQTTFTKLYLHGNGNANLEDGDGTLALMHCEQLKPDSYIYDPLDLPEFPDDAWDDLSGSAATMDFSDWEDRDDTLDFKSPPLAQAVEITGPIEVKLWVSTDGPDTDFTASLLRLEKGGALRHVVSGIQRLRYRKGNAIDAPVKAGQVVEVTIDCWASSLRLEQGDRLVVMIASSNFPGSARNLNTLDAQLTATKARTATNTVYHDTSRPSHILLPVVPRAKGNGLRFE